MGNQTDRPSGRLIFVKHGKPAIVPDIPRSQWALSDEGGASARSLARKLAALEPVRLFSSPERKAHDTALAMGEVLGLRVQRDSDLAEQRADDNAFVSPAEIEALIEGVLREPERLVMGEETGEAARLRFAAAMARIVEVGQGTKVVVAHGRIISLWLSAELGFDPVPFWRRLGFACAAVVDDGRVEIIDPI